MRFVGCTRSMICLSIIADVLVLLLRGNVGLLSNQIYTLFIILYYACRNHVGLFT